MASRITTLLTGSAAATAVGLSLLAAPAAVAQQAAPQTAPQPGTANTADVAVQDTAASSQAEAPLLIGHRGAAGTAPENTVAAFKDGRASGADFFEIDVQLSADGVPFLFHDDTPARTTNVEGVFPDRAHDPITSFTWAELQQLDAGAYFGEEFAGERIPHLDDAARVATIETGVYIEIKSPKNSPGIEQLVAEELRTDKKWQKLVAADKIQVLSFDEASNRTFASIAPEIELQQLSSTVPGSETLAQWAEYADSVGTNYRTLTAQNVADVKAAGLVIGVYTANSPEAVQHSIDLGVDAVTGDFPIQTARYLAGGKPFPSANGVEIVDSVNNPAGSDVQAETGEHVLLRNTTGRSIEVSGSIIRDAANNILAIGDGYVLAPGGELRVYTGPGTNTAESFYNDGTASVLNNGGDSVALWTPQGQLQDVFAN
ncbi:glycerophosphodiester phosphodiesterase family protein [Arthrobacter crystallopoietes]|uniref:glycerophosphodiester phosphodiesterase family protein n=1 Tax=Crystallibacter crystallopoietes TaxID=37928 RepID=UPI0011115F62|nr:glycerophosphodiester phosphodiesterase family protein [Arthrobacter crystallopoietes]QTG81375.1 lamin tail domain-containing protein [Arthrobacter crystallopoietes]